MSVIKTLQRKCMRLTTVIMLMTALSACDNFIFDEEGDCSIHYRLGFRYTKNILNSDAFGSQVSEIELYVFRKDGSLALHKKDRRNLTEENDFAMDVDLPPGSYDMLAWCFGKPRSDSAISFVIGKENIPTSPEAPGAYLPLQEDDGGLVSESDIVPLFHAYSADVVLPDTYGNVNITPLSLTKDTNHISVMLQSTDGTKINPDNILLTLEGAADRLSWLNVPENDSKFLYLPWSARSFATESEYNAGGNLPDGMIAEFSTGRLMADSKQRLTLREKATGRSILSIPLVEYLLLVRDMYANASSAQDYLDRIDDFSLVFFVTGDMEWEKSRIIINGWRIVPPQSGHL